MIALLVHALHIFPPVTFATQIISRNEIADDNIAVRARETMIIRFWQSIFDFYAV